MINRDRLNEIAKKCEIIGESLSDPSIIADNKKWTELVKEHTTLVPICETYAKLCKAEKDIELAHELMASEGEDYKELALMEIEEKKELVEKYENELKVALLPKDPSDDKNVIIEIRGGAGGDEAALFASQLMRMYKMYADIKRWKVEDININMTDIGGVKEAVFSISGLQIYAVLKYESGVHRVQRVPETETQGRIHTSTVTVAVLAEAEDVNIELNDKDIKIDTYRSGGAGGQHINKTDSAVRMTHLPTGIVVQCEDERSQMKNRDKAMKVLKARIFDHYNTIAQNEYAKERKIQVGTGDRSERIRTYNFPQGRITDHRIGLSLFNINDFMNGEMQEMIDALKLADISAKLAGDEK